VACVYNYKIMLYLLTFVLVLCGVSTPMNANTLYLNSHRDYGTSRDAGVPYSDKT